MGLKRFRALWRKSHTELKSDHFGIETAVRDMGWSQASKLKSDHFGIETIKGKTMIYSISSLKSDHFGIETGTLSGPGIKTSNTKIRPFWDWNLKRQPPRKPLLKTKIRPFWDWNWWEKQYPENDEWTKIRPFWDWNMSVGNLYITCCSLKSDHFGIETRNTHSTHT